MLAKTKNFTLIILGILFCLNILAWVVVYDLSKTQLLEVIFFNIGQGDAIFIETPKSRQILIDGGPDSTILEKLAAEMPFWDRSIDLIILTHPEKDHMAGLIEVLKRYKVDYILWTGVVRDTPEYEEWQKYIEKEGAKIFIAKAGQRITTRTVLVEILYPFENLEGEEFKNSNDTSIVARLLFKEDSFLFTGDISSSVEEKLVLSNFKLESDVLKIAHHGSKYSTCDYFLENVLPKIAVIQVGKNPYGHPTQEVLSRLQKFGIKIFRTDEKGDIKFLSNGNSL